MANIYTVTLIDKMEDSFEPWTTSFSTMEKAQAFMDSVAVMLRDAGLTDTWTVSIDSLEINSQYYLSVLRDYINCINDC